MCRARCPAFACLPLCCAGKPSDKQKTHPNPLGFEYELYGGAIRSQNEHFGIWRIPAIRRVFPGLQRDFNAVVLAHKGKDQLQAVVVVDVGCDKEVFKQFGLNAAVVHIHVPENLQFINQIVPVDFDNIRFGGVQLNRQL